VRITFPYLVNTLEFKRTKMVREATEYDLQGRKQWTKIQQRSNSLSSPGGRVMLTQRFSWHSHDIHVMHVWSHVIKWRNRKPVINLC